MGLVDEIERLAYLYGATLTCKKCGAEPGKRCVTRGGKTARMDHADRFYRGWTKAADRKWRDKWKNPA